MIFLRCLFFLSVAILFSCAGNDFKTLSEIQNVEIEIKDVAIKGGVDKAMQGYQQFLEHTADSELTPEAIRRLADLNIEKEYGVIEDTPDNTSINEFTQNKSAVKPDIGQPINTDKVGNKDNLDVTILPDGSNLQDLQTVGANKAIQLYLKLLKKFPLYERNDQVLYQLSRAYEETGNVDKAMSVMNRMIKKYPNSRHFPEVQFRRAEYFFTRKKFLDSEDAYISLLSKGKGTGFYVLALYKLGWTFYKQDLFEEALDNFIALLDHKLSVGYDFTQTHNDIEKKRVEDTYRVISLSFSSLGGADAISSYFKKQGSRKYESEVYRHLAEFYLTKRRYSDAAKTYNAYIDNNPYHKFSPHFQMRVIEIYHKGRFPRLVIKAKKNFASTYALTSNYWKYFNPKKHIKVVGFLKTNIIDLANHYHSLYQNKIKRNKKTINFKEASHWYREFLSSFPKEKESAAINYQLADLYLENKDYLHAAIEYENSAYNYELNDKSSSAGYASVATYRQYLKKVDKFDKNRVKREVVRSSLKFVDVFPGHKKAAIILSAAADDLYDLHDFQIAINTSYLVINNYPAVNKVLKRSSWLVIAYSSFDLHKYANAENAFIKVLAIKSKVKGRKIKRNKLQENLAASVYKQGEKANAALDYKLAANHFLRVGKLVPRSKIRSTADYDAATALIKLNDWPGATQVLVSFRERYKKHKLQSEVTKKLAYVYKQDKKYSKAALEFEAISLQAKDRAIKRESLLIAAELYEQIPDKNNELRIYNKYIKLFSKPIEEALEIRMKIAEIYKSKKDRKKYFAALKSIVKKESRAGKSRNDRTRYLAGTASLLIVTPLFKDFAAIKLVKPFKRNLNKKKKRMKANIKKYNKLVDYHVGNVTAAATYLIAETYYNFSRSLMSSERPTNLNEIELEQYNLILEEQAYPFEDKGINIHKKNIELLSVGVYSKWIDKSLKKLGVLVPGRYAKYEVSTGVINSMIKYKYTVEKLHDINKSTKTSVSALNQMSSQ